MQCDLYLWTLKSMELILDSWGVFVWSFILTGVKWKQWCDIDHCTVTLTFDPEIHRAHSRLMGSLCAKFHDDKCKGKAVMRQNNFTFFIFNLAIFSYQCIVTLTFDLLTRKSLGQNPWLIRSLYVKFHEDRCKGKVVMGLDYFT